MRLQSPKEHACLDLNISLKETHEDTDDDDHIKIDKAINSVYSTSHKNLGFPRNMQTEANLVYDPGGNEKADNHIGIAGLTPKTISSLGLTCSQSLEGR